MTTSLRHPQLDHKERAALETLGVPLDDPNLTIEISWDDSWRTIGTSPGTKKPIAWTLDVPCTVNEIRGMWGVKAIEYGPDEVATTITYENVGDSLGCLAENLSRYLAFDNLDTDAGITLNICGWALWAGGHLA
ncbi:hypothetical protein RCF19_30015 [Rhodococcus qingshengii]